MRRRVVTDDVPAHASHNFDGVGVCTACNCCDEPTHCPGAALLCIGQTMLAGAHRTCSDPTCHGCLPIITIYAGTDAEVISAEVVDAPADRAPWIPEQTLANHLVPDPPDGWHEIDNLTADEAREVAKLAIAQLRRARLALDEIDHHTYGWSFATAVAVIDKVRLTARAALRAGQ